MIRTLNSTHYRNEILKELGLIAVALALGVGSLMLMQKEISASVAAGALVRKTNNESTLLLRRFDHLRSELSATIEVKNSALNALLPTEDIRPLNDALESLASKNGILLGFTASIPQAESQNKDRPLYSISTTLQITGTKDASRRFIRDIERLPYFYSITRFSEQASESGGQVSTVLNAKLWTRPTQALTESPAS
jgi:hypothetical protein